MRLRKEDPRASVPFCHCVLRRRPDIRGFARMFDALNSYSEG
jgi:hypothetical protein